MKLANFLSVDPDYAGKGLKAAGKMDREVWREFSRDRDELIKLAAAIRLGCATVESATEWGEGEDEYEFPEGRIIYRMHRRRERNAKLMQMKKAATLKETGLLACTICGFDFHSRYGTIGEGFIECHHTLPLSMLAEDTKVRTADLALLCSNCHRMVHRRRPWLSMGELRSLVR